MIATALQFGMQPGMQLGMQLDATGCNQQLQSQLQPVATFSDLSKQGLASPRKVHRWVQHVQKPPCTNFRGLHGLLEAQKTAVSQVATWLQPSCNLQRLQPRLKQALQPICTALCNKLATSLQYDCNFCCNFRQLLTYCIGVFRPKCNPMGYM
jgi:hypothetical protein